LNDSLQLSAFLRHIRESANVAGDRCFYEVPQWALTMGDGGQVYVDSGGETYRFAPKGENFTSMEQPGVVPII